MKSNLPVVRFFGNPYEKSGYGNATINICFAFSKSNVLTRFEINRKNIDIKNKLNNYTGETSVDFYIHTPPFKKHMSKNYKIGYFYWEANILPKSWAKDIRSNLDEIWVPCDLTRRACLKSGFRGPIEILHTPCDVNIDYHNVQIPSPVTKELVLSEDTFKFYSVFQWNERKGYRELLKAYCEEFSENDNVILILKVNPINIEKHGLSKIKFDILKIKRMINKKDLPKIFLITKHIDREALMGLHKLCDSFVLPHHGEGWGMPIHDAMLCDSKITTTKFGGITEFLNDDNASIIKHKLGPVRGMGWNSWYRSSQTWANPSVTHLRSLMRMAFENKDGDLHKLENAKKLAASLDINSCALRIEQILSKNRFKRFL